ncbi:hypothetical protein ACFL1X_04630, partial [Candidatus Hydrogenedentota bacterium]
MANLGRIELCTDRAKVFVGTGVELKVIYIVGPGGLSRNGMIRVITPGITPPPNYSNPGAPGFVTTKCSRDNAELEVTYARDHRMDDVFGKERLDRIATWPMRQTQVRARNVDLVEGDTITVTVGEKRFGGPGISFGKYLNIEEYFVCCEVDVDGSQEFKEICDPVPIKVEKKGPAMLRVYGPSIVVPGEKQRITVSAFDENGVDLPDSYEGSVEFSATTKDDSVSGPYKFNAEDGGHKHFNDIVCAELGTRSVHRIEVVDNDNDFEAISAPMVEGLIDDKYKIYWGSIHPHTGISLDVRLNGNVMNTPDDTYIYSREVVGLDFAAVCDHGIGQPDEDDMLPEEWELTKDCARRHNHPGRFVTFSSFEFSSERYGDHNFYFLNDDMPMEKIYDIDKLYEFYRGTDTIIIPHHVAVMRPIDWDHHDPEVEPLVEI